MMTNSKPTDSRTILVIAILCAGLLIILFPLLVQAALPPRPEPPMDRSSKSDPEKTSGAYIALQIETVSPGLWTVVQWQDSAGGWHNVEGWQGTLDGNNTKTWWVAATDFSKGPFRWGIYQSYGGPILVTSESFYLPSTANETIIIVISSMP